MEQVIDRPAVHEVGLDQSGEDDRALNILVSCLGEAQQQEGDECDDNLDAYVRMPAMPRPSTRQLLPQ